MTIPRRAAYEPPLPIWKRITDWARTSWVPAAFLSCACLLGAGLWPRATPPQVPAPVTEQVHTSAPAVPAVHVPTLLTPREPGSQDGGSQPDIDPPLDTDAQTPAAEVPRLRINRLGIGAPMDVVGTVGDEVEIPDDPARVGRWVHGATPGDPTGTVLVTGHVTWNGKRGALWPLASAQAGDLIEVELALGDSTHWLVTDVRTLPRDQDHPELFTTAGNHRLVVVTCGGPIVAGHYRDLVVVEASPMA